MRRATLRAGCTGALAIALSACAPGAKTPRGPAPDLVAAWSEATTTEQTRPSAEALDAALALLDRAVASAGAPRSFETTRAALDALVARAASGLDRVGGPHALAFRTPGGMKKTAERLDAAWEHAGRAGPFVRPAIARAALRLALYEGDAAAAARWQARTGCAREATVVGPLAWPPLVALAHPTPVEAPSAPLAASYPGVAPFAATVAPARVPAEGCDLPVQASSVVEGLRAVVVDVDVPRAQTIGVEVRSPVAATLVVGGREALTRGFELGGGDVVRRARADVAPGRVRIALRVADGGDGTRVELAVTGEDGEPLALRAPAPGDLADRVAGSVAALEPEAPRGPAEDAALVAASALADGDARSAEHLMEETARAGGKSPVAALLLGRALRAADDVPEVRAAERGRSAWETVLKSWPSSWEALVGHAQLTAQRRGASEGRYEAMQELAEARKTGGAALDPLVRAYEARLAADGGLRDELARALGDLRAPLGGTPLLASLEATTSDRVGAEREALACAGPGLDRSDIACFQAKLARGDHAGGLAELARLRALAGAPEAWRSLELATKLAMGDEAGALAVHDRMLPAERTLSTLALLLPRAPSELRARLLSEAMGAPDAPAALGPLYRALGDDPAREAEARAVKAIADDRARGDGDGAATLVLLHDERYDVAPGGLLRWTLHDVRRVSGTTDVEQGAQVFGPTLEAREVRRLLRRRIFKRDGRVLEPDRSQRAAQGHADLTQLERGDWIEMFVEGWALPGPSGQLVLDTPDLLPERTGVKAATIEVRRPASLALTTWSHPMLGKVTETAEGATKVSRWTVADRAPRRLEEGVARMDRDVSVSLGTASWQMVGRAVAEAAAALSDRDPTVARWAREAGNAPAEPRVAAGTTSATSANGGPASGEDRRAIIDRVVAATGKSLKVASPMLLSDSAAALSSGSQVQSARSMLELGEGSRSWLVRRALAELGIDAEIVVAERDPFSADPAYPAHFGRFDQPLVVAHLAGTNGVEDVWIDADVAGPPLPAGRVSPELRGRVAMRADGTTIPVGGAAGDDARDEIDVRLAVDAHGDAKGTFVALLRGRQAQSIADALELVVGSERRDLLRSVVLGWLPWANVDDVSLSSSEGSWQVSLRAQVSIPGYAQPEGKSWVLPGLEPVHGVYPRPWTSTLANLLASQGARESALSISSAHQWHARRRVELPPGATLSRPPPGVEVKDAAIEATRKGGIRGNVIEEDFALSLPTGTVAAQRWPAFAATLHRIDDAFLAGARLKR